MIRNALSSLIAVVALHAFGCASQPAHFETSDVPPEETTKEPSGPVGEYEPPATPAAASIRNVQIVSEHFLLALQTSSPQSLEDLLTPDATIRQQSSGSGVPALPALAELMESWNSTQLAPAGRETSLPPFGPATIVELNCQPDTAWATVDVLGPTKVRGLWKLRLETAVAGPRIVEVVLPKNH